MDTAYSPATVKLEHSDGGATPVYTVIGTTSIAEEPETTRETYYPSNAVSSGRARRKTATGGVGTTLNCELVLENDAAATPAMVAGAAIIAGFYNAPADAIFRRTLADATTKTGTWHVYDVNMIGTVKTQDGAVKVTWKMDLQGVEA